MIKKRKEARPKRKQPPIEGNRDIRNYLQLKVKVNEGEANTEGQHGPGRELAHKRSQIIKHTRDLGDKSNKPIGD